ncbi:hypothetical protein Tco_0590825 [Tanacetum coccineum]
MLLAMKDEARSHHNNEENDFMLDTAYGEESLDELTASVMLMARLQPADGNTDTVPLYDETVSALGMIISLQSQAMAIMFKAIS